MATFQQRGKAWRVQVRLRGVTKSATFDTKEEGRAWASQVEAKALAEARQDSPKENGFILVSEIFEKYRLEVSVKKRGKDWEDRRIKALRKIEIFNVPFRDFSSKDLANWRDERLKSVSPSTVNRDFSLLGPIFTYAAKEWGIGSVAANPVWAISKPKNPKARQRRISNDEIAAITQQLGWDGTSPPRNGKQWTAWVMHFAVETAMRRGEILSITWEQVDLGGMFVALRDGETKNGDGREVPLSERASELLEMLSRGRPNDRVAQVGYEVSTLRFREARRAVGLDDIRLHDSRREATTRIAPLMADPLTLARVTGHRDLRSLMVYYKPTGTDLAKKLRAKSKE